MRKPTRHAVRLTAAFGAVAALVLLPAASASAVSTNSSAYGVKSTLLTGVVVGPLATSTCPTGGPDSVVSANLGALGGTGVINADSACDDAAGTSSATGSAAGVALLTPLLVPLLPAISATLISATCNGAAPDAPTGSSTFTNATIGGVAINSSPGANTNLLNLTNVVVITINEQTTGPAGVLTVNALHVAVGPIVNGVGSLADVVIGHAACGPNAVVVPGDAFSFQNLPIILGGIAVLAMIGMAVRTGTRRLRGLA
ncbi:MAG: hypothetical protein QOF87_26 [Pseudonocardiales bacterium]|jgi:hypothetical protein|nr:hypothetical protein [Pseudonocardiales bacterium]MDT4908929.1 hypothetical protein [Pseudonocardiales bacterium]MDT4960379.1 hypothetical protein [Pseudonocardiales bacterium]MDT4970399.1 hypothetical protein [Pseudonocardiales bacterium]